MPAAPTPASQPVSAFVHIIESPSGEDLFEGRTEGRMLSEALRLAGIRGWYRVASGVATFDRALGSELLAAVNYHRAFPILHVSAHGDAEGIGLTDGSFITWDQLRDRLVPINTALGGGLVVCVSSCFGASGCRMAMHENEPLPFFALLGHFGSPTWSDAAVAFVAFYHRLFKGAHVSEAISAMEAASGVTGFNVQYGQQIQQGWATFIRQKRWEDFQGMLESLTIQEGAGPAEPEEAATGDNATVATAGHEGNQTPN